MIIFTEFVNDTVRPTLLQSVEDMKSRNLTILNNSAYSTSFRLWRQWLRFMLGESITEGDADIVSYTPIVVDYVKSTPANPRIHQLTEVHITESEDFWSATKGRFSRDAVDDPKAKQHVPPAFVFKDIADGEAWTRFGVELSNLFVVRDNNLSDKRDSSLWRLYTNTAITTAASTKWSLASNPTGLPILTKKIIQREWIGADAVAKPFELINFELTNAQYETITTHVIQLLQTLDTDFGIHIPPPFADAVVSNTSPPIMAASKSSTVFSKFARFEPYSALLAMPEFYAQVAFCITLLCTITNRSIAPPNDATIQCVKFNLLGLTLYDTIESSINNLMNDPIGAVTVEKVLPAEMLLILSTLPPAQRTALVATLLNATQVVIAEKTSVSMLKTDKDRKAVEAWKNLVQSIQPQNNKPPFVLHVPSLDAGKASKIAAAAATSSSSTSPTKQYAFWTGNIKLYQRVFNGLVRAIAVRVLVQKHTKASTADGDIDTLLKGMHNVMLKRELDASFLFWHCVWSTFVQHGTIRLNTPEFEQTCSQRLFVAAFGAIDWFERWNAMQLFFEQQLKDAKPTLEPLISEHQQKLRYVFGDTLH